LCKLVGHSREELLKVNFQAITHPADLDGDVKLVQDLLAGRINCYQLEKRYLHKDGHSVWILLVVSLVRTESGEPSFFVSQVQDISARRELEARIRESSLQDELHLNGLKTVNDKLGHHVSARRHHRAPRWRRVRAAR
jgi:PAS domain S-box-containing protein